jgi:predicted transcriptional regulator of viral defense system
VRSLSKTEAKIVLSLEAEGKDLVSLEELRRRAQVSPGFARKLAHGLVKKGWLERIRRGTYLLNPTRNGPDAIPDADPFRLGSRLATPYYFGYATAAELRRVLPQASRVYYIVTPARRASGKVPWARFRIVHVVPNRFFGFEPLTRREVGLVASDLERTVLDCMNRPELAGGMAGVAHVLAMAKPRLDWVRFGSYLDRFGNRSLVLRAGYLSEVVRPALRPPHDWIARRRARPHEPFVPLGPPSVHGRRGRHDPRWHVICNVSDRDLFAEGEVR